MDIELEKILDIYEKEVSKNMKNKEKVYRFERYKMMNINRIYLLLQDENYHGGYYNIFLIKYPKYRIVMSLNTIDKVINHYATRYFLMPELEKKLDIRNVATRKNMGRDYGIKLLKKYMNEMKTRGEFYALKLDISKYFYTIDHNVLKDMLKKDMKNEKEYQFLCHIIDSTNRPYINHRIQSLKEKELKTAKRKKEVEKIPFYEYNKGLPIGNMTSQFLSIYYLHELDHKIVHNFKIKHYVRYMDDFILLSRDKKKLEQVRDEIERILNEKYKLTLNHKKTKIISSKEGFSFCGYRFRVIDNKTILTVCKESEMRIKKRIKEVSSLYQKKKLTFEQAFSSINTYYYGFKFGSKKRIRRAVDRYFFKG